MKHGTRYPILGLCLALVSAALGQTPKVLTLEESLRIALGQSFDAARIEQNLTNAQMSLRAAEAGLKSNSELRLSNFPDFQDNEAQTTVSSGRQIFPRQRVLRFQADLFINQPVRLTDGVFSLVGSFQRKQDFGEFQDVAFDENGVPQPITVTDPLEFAPQLRLQFRQPLFTLNQLNTNFVKSALNLEKTEHSYTRSQLDLVYNVTTNFYNLFKAQQQLEIDTKQVEQSREAFRIANLKQQAGLLPEVEVLRLEVDLANARNRASASEAALKETEDFFKVLIGLPIEDSIEVTTHLTYAPIEVTLEKALAEALSRRPELREDEIELELSSINVKEVDAQREIKGELNMRYGIFNRDDNLSGAFQRFNQDRSVVLDLTVPLWDWSKNKYEVEAAKANVENTRLSQRNRIEIIKQEIRKAVRDLKSAQQRVDITRRSEELAEKSYNISLLKFQNGDLSSQDLALEQNRLTEARTNSLNAIIDYKNALSDLRRKTLWDFEKNKAVGVKVSEN
ncbi:MAG: TolC family protein [bacterium]